MPLTPDEVARLVLEESRANQQRKKRSEMPPTEESMADPQRRPRIDWTFNVSNLLTMGTLVFGLFAAWGTMDKRVLMLEENRAVQRERDAGQDVAIKEGRQEVRDALVDLRRSVEKVQERVGAK